MFIVDLFISCLMIFNLTFIHIYANYSQMQGLALNNPIQPAGTKTRAGRPPKWMTYNFDRIADNAFALADKFLKYAHANWDTFSHAEKLSSVQLVTPLALKRIPDKHEVVQLTLNATEDEMRGLLGLARGNIEARGKLSVTHSVQPITKPTVVEAQAITSTDNQDVTDKGVN